MKIIALPDLHGHKQNLPELGPALSKVDLVILAGDLTTAGPVSDAEAIIQEIRNYNENILAVPGNMDRGDIEAYLTREGINLNHQHRVIDGLAFIGMGGALRGPVKTPNEVTEEDLEKHFQEAVSGLDPKLLQVLVCHQPPADTKNDLARTQAHVGSQAVRKFIEAQQPLICFTGHIHEATGVDRIGKTQVINPGPLWQGGYAYAEITPEGLKDLKIKKVP